MNGIRTAADLGTASAQFKTAGALDALLSPAVHAPSLGMALGMLAGGGLSNAMTGRPNLAAMLGGGLAGTGLGGAYAYNSVRNAGRGELDALRAKRKRSLSEQELRDLHALEAMGGEFGPALRKNNKVRGL